MKKSVIVMSVAALVLCCAAAGYFWYVNRDKRMVVELIGNVAALAEKESGKLPHEGVLKFSKVDNLFAQKIELRCADPAISASLSREELKTLVALMIKRIDHMKVNTANIEVNVAGDNATFSLDAEFSGVISGKKEEFANVYQISGIAVKSDGKWLISSLIAEQIIQ